MDSMNSFGVAFPSSIPNKNYIISETKKLYNDLVKKQALLNKSKKEEELSKEYNVYINSHILK